MPQNIHVSQIEDKAEWEALISHYPEANFLQSWNWGVFHTSLGKHITRLAWFSDQTVVAVAQIVRETAKRGTYLTLAGGPLVDWNQKAVVAEVMTELRRQGKAQKADFIRFRPQQVNSEELHKTLADLGCLDAPMHVTADITVKVDLTQPPEALLAGFRKSTRYEIKRAEKLGINVRMSQNSAEIETMYQDQLALAAKHGFVPFSREFWKNQFEAFVGDDQVALFHAELDGKVLASAFVIFYNKEAVYHYGTSTPENAKLPGSYACQWAVILEAQRRGCRSYNLWGIAPANQPDHRFAGVTTFKTGFSEAITEYIPAQDLPLSWKYQLTRLFELWRKKSRKL